jgi:hypothetical protein
MRGIVRVVPSSLFCILGSPSGFRRPLVSDARMILMKAADEAGECLVRASELSRLSICVFAGHHGTCPFKCDLHIQYAFRYTMSLLLLECLATNFVAWISRQVHRGAKRRGGCISPHLANGDEDHPSEIADRTAHSPGPAGRGSVRCQSLVDRNALHFEGEPQVFLTSSR